MIIMLAKGKYFLFNNLKIQLFLLSIKISNFKIPIRFQS